MTEDFTNLPDLACARLGGRAIAANDEFFAAKENLLKPGRGEFRPHEYTDRGKWMDGWETRRRREPGHDWCVIRLGVPGVIRGVNIDTNHFRGNHPEAASIDACQVDGDPSVTELQDHWRTILPRSELRGHAENFLPIQNAGCCTHVRLNIYPDGGVARLRVHGEPQRPTAAPECTLDVASAANGGTVVACSDDFFGQPANMLMPEPAVNMGDGWETRRRRGPGHDWCVIRLGCRCVIETIEVDTTHFKGNYPDQCSLEGFDAEGAVLPDTSRPAELLAATPLGPDALHHYEIEPARRTPCTHVRLNIYPDGGVSRLRIFGRAVEP